MLGSISLDTLAVLWLGALLGGIAAGASGFAFALAATSIWLHRIDPIHSAVLRRAPAQLDLMATA